MAAFLCMIACNLHAQDELLADGHRDGHDHLGRGRPGAALGAE